MPTRKLLPAALVALAALLAAGARAEDELTRDLTCPLDGQHFAARTIVATNEAGGRDSDGCRWAIDRTGRLEVLELREIVACPRCGMALYRAHLDAAAKLHRRADEAPIASALAAAGPLDAARLETTVAHAVATYRALGLDALGVKTDPDAFEGQLWLRAAWAVRMRLVRDEEQPVLPVQFAPRTPEGAVEWLGRLELQAAPPADGPQAAAPLEDALSSLDQARGALEPLDAGGKPSRRLAFERVRGALDVVEQTLLLLRASTPADSKPEASGLAARKFALAIARASHRAGDAVRREQWMADATSRLTGDVPAEIGDEASRLRTWTQLEDAPLGLAAAALERAAQHAEGPRRFELLALAADAMRRRVSDVESDLLPKARELARRAADGEGPGARHGRFLLERLERPGR